MLLPIRTIPEVPRLIGSPDTVTPDPPAIMVLLATNKPEDPTVNVCP